MMENIINPERLEELGFNREHGNGDHAEFPIFGEEQNLAIYDFRTGYGCLNILYNPCVQFKSQAQLETFLEILKDIEITKEKRQELNKICSQNRTGKN